VAEWEFPETCPKNQNVLYIGFRAKPDGSYGDKSDGAWGDWVFRGWGGDVRFARCLFIGTAARKSPAREAGTREAYVNEGATFRSRLCPPGKTRARIIITADPVALRYLLGDHIGL